MQSMFLLMQYCNNSQQMRKNYHIKFTQSKLCLKIMWEASFPGFDIHSHTKLQYTSVKMYTHVMHNEKHALYIYIPLLRYLSKIQSSILCMASNRFRHTHIHAKADQHVHMYYKFVFLHQHLYRLLFQHPQIDTCLHTSFRVHAITYRYT